jgi:hypothetical protein
MTTRQGQKKESPSLGASAIDSPHEMAKKALAADGPEHAQK